MMVIKKFREFALIAASTCVLIYFIVYGSFQAAYMFVPIIDTTGANFDNMQVVNMSNPELKTTTFQQMFRPGDIIGVRFQFQKARSVAGWIKWTLVNHQYSSNYSARMVTAPAGIYDVFSQQEVIPLNAPPGRYHMVGTLTYPLPSVWFMRQTVSYKLTTECFIVVH